MSAMSDITAATALTTSSSSNNTFRKRKLPLSNHSSGNTTILLLGGCALCFTMVSIFGPTRHVVEHHHSTSMSHIVPNTHATKKKKSHPPPPRKIVRVEELAHEAMFQSTIKSCVPKENAKNKCKEYIAPKEDPPMQRVALLSPPGVISSTLMKQLDTLAHKHNHHTHRGGDAQHQQQQPENSEIDVFETTHVPPYGYGKTHGLTKIVRVVPKPLVLEVTDALQALLYNNEEPSDVTLEDLQTALRQILRFHCRLSHVAAHTALLSVPFMEMVTDPDAAAERVQSFLVPNDGDANDDRDSEEDAADDDSMTLFDSEEAYGARMLSYVQENTPHIDILQALDQVLLEEMKLTKNMTAWPCPGFWASGPTARPTALTNLTQRLAKQLAPDCADPLASCWVGRDKCEAAGDGVCKGQK